MARLGPGRKATLRWRVWIAVGALVLALWATLLVSMHDSAASLGARPAMQMPVHGGDAGGVGARGGRETKLETDPVFGASPPAAADSQWANATHLIIVAGHTVFMGTDFSGPSAETERDWYLLSYQQGQLSWFIDHIKSGIAKAAQGEKLSETHYEK